MVKIDVKHRTGSVYTPAELEDSILRMQRSGHDYHRKFVDYELLDAFKYLMTINDEQQFGFNIIEQARRAVKDDKVTKMFKNVETTNSSFFHYLGNEKPNFTWNENFRAASSILEETLIKSMKPLVFNNQSDLLDSFSNKKASSGFIGRGSKADNIDEIFSRFIELKEMIANGGSPDTFALSFHRSQISGYCSNGVFTPHDVKYKDRLVWGIDAATVALESQYAIPFIENMMDNCSWYAGGKDSMELGSMIRKHLTPSHWYSLDFSKFDQTVPSWLIKHAFYLVGKCFSPDCNKELKWIQDNFINTKIILLGGQVVEKHRGIPSGSNFTQAIGSICNALVILSYLLSLEDSGPEESVSAVLRKTGSVTAKDMGMWTMGDDNLFMYHGSLNLEDLSKYVEHNFGMEIHPSKTHTGSVYGVNKKSPIFLKREWRQSGAYRDPLEIIINTIHPERDRRSELYNPYALVYGLYLTYPGAFSNYFSEGDILRRMAELKILRSLRHLEAHQLPGSVRALGDKGVSYIQRRAKTFLKSG